MYIIKVVGLYSYHIHMIFTTLYHSDWNRLGHFFHVLNMTRMLVIMFQCKHIIFEAHHRSSQDISSERHGEASLDATSLRSLLHAAGGSDLWSWWTFFSSELAFNLLPKTQI